MNWAFVYRTTYITETQSGPPPYACNFVKKETLAQVFSCEFCEIFKGTFFYRTPPVAASLSKIENFAAMVLNVVNYWCQAHNLRYLRVVLASPLDYLINHRNMKSFTNVPLKNFTYLTGKHLPWNLFLIKSFNKLY